MTDNLCVDSRRCAPICPQITTSPTAPEATPHLGFRDTCIAAHRERAIFLSLPGCPRIQWKGTYSNSLGMRTRELSSDGLGSSSASQEFDTTRLLLNFVNSVRWGRVPRSRGFDFKPRLQGRIRRAPSRRARGVFMVDRWAFSPTASARLTIGELRMLGDPAAGGRALSGQ